MKPLNKIKTIWSSKLAYVVGLITTDGSLSRDGRHINFTSKDIQLIKTFKNCLGIKNNIKTKGSGFSDKKYFYVQFGDVLFYKWLLSIGLSPGKTKIMSSLKIPEKYFFDFLRGHLDGDGCYYSYWDKRWKSSFMFYLNFISASKKHILWIKKEIKNLLQFGGSLELDKRNGIYKLRFAKTHSRIIIAKMYHKKNLPLLTRKYEKIKKILKIDDKENERVL